MGRTGVGVRNNLLRAALTSVSHAALRTGRYGEAEAAATERAALPPNAFTEADPTDDLSRAQVTLAHALVLQGRGAEALAAGGPALAHFDSQVGKGQVGLTISRDLGYALFIDALARPAGNARRAAQLERAARLIDGLSTEARALLDMRELRGWIESARKRI
jgi:hypothetical protein